MSTIRDLKGLLIDTLVEQVENGVKVVTKQGEVVEVDAPAPVLAVAAKVIKDWADEAKDDERANGQIERLSTFLQRKRPDLKVAGGTEQ